VGNLKKYDYMPEDFKGLYTIEQDLMDFYHLLEQYNADKTGINKTTLENQYEDLFFTLKHNFLNGFITEELWHEINEYVGGLIDD